MKYETQKDQAYYGLEAIDTTNVYKSSKRSQNLENLQQFSQQFESLPLHDRCAEFAGKIRSQLTTRGTPIGSNDLLIVAVALAHDRGEAQRRSP
ncbi:MAG: type II toxin-antitoxin system VapC family toxin [Prochlorotrichaceae cyanobacterium]